MRSLRALTAAALVLVGPAVRAVHAQQPARWNDEGTRTLVSAAIARRAAQLADTGLADYTARAHGYVTFLAQLGDGFPTPPIVVKSDELMVEVYWGAPDRSKQRIIGRRDTLLLPTDINYHRDHLAVVQNNFPAIIRLGDGDEVRDVPHPLSEAGAATYDYQVVDSITIRTGDRVIEVVQVNVRPKDDRAPAAVGAVFIDRQTASVVRMTFSFTRAALKDRQLEDVSVILENGLVDGRFWLPRRQEIEIRRSATWMDFPARGIIRGRWEVCCVQTNVQLPRQQFVGPEIVEAPRAQQRAFPFEGELLKQLPEEVRALDAVEVRRVQEEARALFRAGALARARNGAPSARSVSDIVRVNRVEGLAFGGGLSQSLGGGLRLSAYARYGLADYAFKGRGALAWESAGGSRLTVEARDDFAEAGDTREVSGLRNSIAAQEFGSDWTDPYGVRGYTLRFDRAPRGRRRAGIELATEEHRPLLPHGVPTAGRYLPLLAFTPATIERATLDWGLTFAPDADERRLALDARLLLGRTAAGPPSPVRFARIAAEADARVPLAGGSLQSRTLLAAISGGDAVPLEYLPVFGGPVSAPGYLFHSLRGRAGIAQRIEWQHRVPFVALDLGRFGRVPSSLVLAPYLHGVLLRDAGGGWSSYPSVGVGAIGLFDLLRIDVARTLRGNRWLFSLDASRDFWKVL